MSATFNKLTIVGSTTLALMVLASGASAAPSLGLAKNRPYYGSTNQSSGSRAIRHYSPAYSTETRQSFSYEPGERGVRANDGCRPRAVAPQANKSVTKSDVAKKDAAAAPQTTRRSYSYEPAIQPTQTMRGYNRGSVPTKEAWQYQKTDPRRNAR